MSWATVGVAAGTALLGAYQASEQRRAQRDAVEAQNQANLKVNKAQTEFSPWTGIKPQGYQAQAVPVGQSDLGGAVQGGLGGAMFAMQAKQASQANNEKALENEFNNMPIEQGADVSMNPWATKRRMIWAGNNRGPTGGGYSA